VKVNNKIKVMVECGLDESVIRKLVNNRIEKINNKRNKKNYSNRKSVCDKCNMIVKDIKRCAKCKKVKYCSQQCQISDWPTHKINCNKQ
jgi:hypothetical protein